MLDFIYKCQTIACSFDKTPTEGTVLYQLFILLFTIAVLVVFSRIKKNILTHYFVMVVGAFVFEFFTSPMWINQHLGDWAYIYHGVSWVLTLGLASMTLLVVLSVDHFLPKMKESKKYFLCILLLWPMMVVIEKLVINLNIRGYATETELSFTSTMVPIIGMSWLAILYLPLLFSLIIAFYKYFSFQIDKRLLLPINKSKSLRNLSLTFIGVLLFELLVGSMVNNVNFPSWSYIWRDITILLTGGWVLVVWISTWFVDKYFINKSLTEKFVLYLVYATIVITPVEAWLIHAGYRSYQPNAVANFSGFTTPILNVPVEIIFAVPFYLALVVAFARYWEIVIDNKL